MLKFERLSAAGSDRCEPAVRDLVIAGWTSRDEVAQRHHMEELAALGVPPPSTTPVFYRVAAANLTQASRVEVLGPDTSGEVEPVVFALDDGLWLTVGSDHTDRKAETVGIALSKQLCAKPVASAMWRLDEVAGHWDELRLRSHAVIDGARVLYQDGTLVRMHPPGELVRRLTGGRKLAAGTAMFCGTMPAIGGIRPAARFEMELIDPVLDRTLTHAYDIAALPVVS